MSKTPANPSSFCTKAQAAKFYEPKTYGPEQSIGYLMRRIISLLSQEIDAELDPTGLTHAQWLPLFAMLRGKADTGAALARVCELDAGATTRMLDRLEDKGLIARERSAEDRRVVHLHLTGDGQQAADKIAPAMCRVHNAALTGFSQEEWETLRHLLQRMLSNMEAMRAQRDQDHE